MLLLTESTLRFVNLLVSDYESKEKKSLSGTVEGWATNVHEKTLLKGSANTTPNPSASGGALSSQSTKLNTLTTGTTTSTQHLTVSNTRITTRFGGLDLDSGAGEETAPFENREGKPNDSITLVAHSSVDRNVETEDGSQIPPRQCSLQARVPSVGKRKIQEIILESNPEGDEMVESSMQVDTGATQEFTSHQTSVSVRDTQPVTKKVRIEPGSETVTSVDALKTQKARTGGTKPKSRRDYKNSDLPIPADHKWTNAFMDTVILWAGGQPNIWSIPDGTLAAALQEIFTTIYPDVQYEVTIHGAVFGVAWQRLLEWRSGFGSIALVMIMHFFWGILKGNPDSEDSNATIRDLARHFISPPCFPFIHEDCDEPDPVRNFRSVLILLLISAAHLSKTISAVDIQSLETAKLKKGYGMECVIALAAAALERAFTFVRDGFIDIQDGVKEMAEKITVEKTLNQATGNMSKGASIFSMDNWGGETQSYAVSVTKKGPENTADIIASAYALLDHGSDGTTISGPSDADTVDLRALLWYFFRKLDPWYQN